MYQKLLVFVQIMRGEKDRASDPNFETLYLKIRAVYKHETLYEYYHYHYKQLC